MNTDPSHKELMDYIAQLEQRIERLENQLHTLATPTNLMEYKSNIACIDSCGDYNDKNDPYAYNYSGCEIHLTDQYGSTFNFVALDNNDLKKLLNTVARTEFITKNLKKSDQIEFIEKKMRKLHESARITHKAIIEDYNKFTHISNNCMNDLVDNRNKIVNKMKDVTKRANTISVDKRDLLIEEE